MEKRIEIDSSMKIGIKSSNEDLILLIRLLLKIKFRQIKFRQTRKMLRMAMGKTMETKPAPEHDLRNKPKIRAHH